MRDSTSFAERILLAAMSMILLVIGVLAILIAPFTDDVSYLVRISTMVSILAGGVTCLIVAFYLYCESIDPTHE